MSETLINSLSTKFTADATSFNTTADGVVQKLKATASASDAAAAKVKMLGEDTDRSAKLQEQAVERSRRAFLREEASRKVAEGLQIDRQRELARVRDLAALKADIEARATERSSIAKKADALYADREAQAVKRAAAAQEAHGLAVAKVGKFLEGTMGAMGITVAVGAAIAGVKELVTSTMEEGVVLGKLHEQTGISVEDLSVLKFAAAETGIEFETVTKAFKKLAVTAYETDQGNQMAAKGFEQLGITAEDVKAKGDDMYAVLAMVADKFHEMPDGIAKSDTAAKIFGARMGSELIPLLNQGSEALQRFKGQAPIFSEDDVERAHRLHQAMVGLHGAMQNLGLATMDAFGPVMTWYLNNFAAGVEAIADAAKDAVTWLARVEPLEHPDADGKDEGYGLNGRGGMRGTRGGNGLWKYGDASTLPGASADLGSGGHSDKGGDGGGSGSADHVATWAEIVAAFNEKQFFVAPLSEAFKDAIAHAAEVLEAQNLLKDQAGQRDWDKATSGSMPSVFPAAKMPDVTMAPWLDRLNAKMAPVFSEWIQNVTSLNGITDELSRNIEHAADTTNKEFAKWMTGQKTNFRKAVQQSAGGFVDSGLKSADGKMSFNPLGSTRTGTDSVGNSIKSGGLSSLLSLFSKAPAAFGSGINIGGAGNTLGGLDMSIFGARADGGFMKPGGFYLTGERGPELLQVGATSAIASNRDTKQLLSGSGAGGDVHHHWNIDARGTDPALSMANFQRALQQTHAAAVADGARAVSERMRRTPH